MTHKGTGPRSVIDTFLQSGNPIDWYPVTTNTAGDLRLGSGSTFVKAIETKREILIWTDTALTSMRFIGPLPLVYSSLHPT